MVHGFIQMVMVLIRWVYNNGVLELRAGSANNIAFNSGVFSPRVWNGVVYYGPAGPPPVIPSLSFWGLMLLALTLVLFFSYSRFYEIIIVGLK